MSFQRLNVLAAAIAVGLSTCGFAAAEEWGTLTGKFVLDGKAPKPAPISLAKEHPDCNKHKVLEEKITVGDKGELANVFVYLKTKNPAVAPSYKESEKATVVLDNRECRFEPHCLVYRVGQTLSVKNSDTFGHNSNFSPILNPGFNQLIPAGEAVPVHFDKEETMPTKVGCNIHNWMGAWILIRKDPYGAVSDKDGTFTIKDLPAGKELEFQLWHGSNLKNLSFKGGKSDSKGRFKLKIKPYDNDLGEIKVPLSALNK
jgi:plastocyanin